MSVTYEQIRAGDPDDDNPDRSGRSTPPAGGAGRTGAAGPDTGWPQPLGIRQRMMEVSFQKCSPTHPLVVQAPLADVRAPFIGAWLWQTCQDGDLLDDVDGRPTKAECGACLDVLLGLGRISFLSESRSDFSGEQYEQVDGFGGKTYRRHFPAFSRWTLPALVSTRCRDASPDLFFAFGNWSLGTQALLLMTGSSRPDHVERDLLMRVNSGRAPKDDIPNLLARLVPMVDGCGLIAMSSAFKVIDDLSSAFTSGRR